MSIVQNVIANTFKRSSKSTVVSRKSADKGYVLISRETEIVNGSRRTTGNITMVNVGGGHAKLSTSGISHNSFYKFNLTSSRTRLNGSMNVIVIAQADQTSERKGAPARFTAEEYESAAKAFFAIKKFTANEEDGMDAFPSGARSVIEGRLNALNLDASIAVSKKEVVAYSNEAIVSENDDLGQLVLTLSHMDMTNIKFTANKAARVAKGDDILFSDGNYESYVLSWNEKSGRAIASRKKRTKKNVGSVKAAVKAFGLANGRFIALWSVGDGHYVIASGRPAESNGTTVESLTSAAAKQISADTETTAADMSFLGYVKIGTAYDEVETALTAGSFSTGTDLKGMSLVSAAKVLNFIK